MIMRVEVPISIGELFDKISILKIKQEKINDTKMLDHINLELSLLNNVGFFRVFLNISILV